MYEKTARKPNNLREVEIQDATVRQDTWDFGTVRPSDRQAIIDRRNKSYDWSSDDEEPTGVYESSQSQSTNEKDPFATIRDMRGIDTNLLQAQLAESFSDGLGSKLSFDSVSDRSSDTIFSKREERKDSRARQSTGPSSLSSGEDQLGQGSSYHRAIVPVLNDLRTRAEGFPVALKSIDQLQRCLLEVEHETTGLIDTFVVALVKKGMDLKYHRL